MLVDLDGKLRLTFGSGLNDHAVQPGVIACSRCEGRGSDLVGAIRPINSQYLCPAAED
jgi:hypothetical protein